MKSFICLLLLSNMAFAKTSYYQLSTQIGGTVFKDLLIIDDSEKSKDSLTVPGQFSTRLRSLITKEEKNFKRVSFDFETIENNQKITGNYILKLYDDKKVEGSLNLDKQFFPIEGKEIYEE